MDIPLSIKELQDSITEKKYTHIDLVDTHLNRIELYDEKINSFITVTKDSAYKDAKKCDKIVSELGGEAFKKYPLLGVVVALKDLFSTKGIRTTAGSKLLENYVSLYDATVVSKLKEAGCIIIGKTNCDAWAHGASGENSDYGPTRNPYNLDLVPGGSSSGSAASIASDFCLVSTGTDTGGSIRQPANFCGVVGLKPTYGSVSRYGIIAMSSSLDSIGHFSKNVSDSERVFNVTKGIDGYDATLQEKITPPQKGKLTIGVPKEYFTQGISAVVKDEVKRVIKTFEDNGFNIKEVSLPLTKYAISVYYIIQPGEVSSNLGRYDGTRYGYKRESFGSEAKRRIMLGTYVLSAGYFDKYYLKAMKVRSKIIEDFDNVFENVDAIIAPVSPTTAFKLGEKNNDPVQMYLSDIYTVSANIAGIPGLAIPSNVTKEGLPLGFQILGKKFSENILFDIGKRFEIFNKISIPKPTMP
jgi:aspartyl-tRNA(Asn)/glutamyl-tRNA(Gln) amidotransferase subunit A